MKLSQPSTQENIPDDLTEFLKVYESSLTTHMGNFTTNQT